MTKEEIFLQSRIYKALAENDHAMLEAALVDGADPNWLPDYGPDFNHSPDALPLHRAAMENDWRAVDILLNWGADVEKRNVNGDTALAFALRNKCIEASLSLLEAGAQIYPDALPAPLGMQDYTTQELLELQDEAHSLIADFQSRPRINPAGDPAQLKERLFRRNQNRHTPLDNRQAWEEFDRIGEILLEQGQPVTKEEWFSENAFGEEWISVAVKFRCLDKVLHHLRAQGDRLTVDELLESPKLLRFICEKGQQSQLFTPEQLKQEGLAGFRRLHNGVKDLQVGHVPQFQAVSVFLSSLNPGRGRA